MRRTLGQREDGRRGEGMVEIVRDPGVINTLMDI